ncbi:MAG: aminotransferase class IV [Bdellovibrionia bacterium]
MNILSAQDILARLSENKNPHWKQYLLMYNSWLGGFIEDPSLMVVPVDDHLVHRGDGVFEAIKVKNSKMWLVGAHLQRLMSSAQKIQLQHAFSVESIQEICEQMIQKTAKAEAMLRIFLSRGPGAFSTNPYDSIGAQLYVVITAFNPLPESKYVKGVRIAKSATPPKEEWLAQVKTCNYLPNVMMKKEAVDAGCDFMIGVDGQGFVTESSTENIIILDSEGYLCRPTFQRILKGTTMTRALELAQSLVTKQLVRGIKERPFTWDEVKMAKEVMMVGTTLDILPVSKVDDQEISLGVVAKELRHLLISDQISS